MKTKLVLLLLLGTIALACSPVETQPPPMPQGLRARTLALVWERSGAPVGDHPCRFDDWGREFRIALSTFAGATEHAWWVSSQGPDGEWGGTDDIHWKFRYDGPRPRHEVTD